MRLSLTEDARNVTLQQTPLLTVQVEAVTPAYCVFGNTTERPVVVTGGGGEIRTHEGLAPLPVFKTGALNRSATPPLSKSVL